MNTFFRIIVGLILIIIYSLIFTGTVDWFSGYNKAQSLIFDGKSIALVKASGGILFIYLMALGSIYLISFTKEWYKTVIGFCLIFLLLSILLAFG